MRAAWTVVAATALCTGACGAPDEGASPSSVTRFDSAGVTVVDNGPLDPSPDLLVSPDPVLRIGELDGAPAYQLFRVSDVGRLSDGGVAVANGGSRQLMVYGADGVHRFTAGGAGQGPSEFQYPQALTVRPGDTIHVQDFVDRVVFGPDGSFVRRETHDRSAFAALADRMGGMSEGGLWLDDGSWFAPIYYWSQEPPVPGPPYRPPMTLVRASPDLAEVDTLGSFGGILQQFVDIGGTRGVRSFVPPFAVRTEWDAGPGGVLVVGDNARPQLHRFGPDGSHRIVRWAAEPEAVSAAEVEAWKDAQRNASWTQGQLPDLERGWAAMELPERKPFFGRAAVGSDGWLWISTRAWAPGPTSLLAFDADGVHRGRVDLPGPFTVHDSGPGWLLGVMLDESEVEYVHVYEVRTR